MSSFGWSLNLPHIQYTGDNLNRVLEFTKLTKDKSSTDDELILRKGSVYLKVSKGDYIFVLGYSNYALITPSRYKYIPRLSKSDKAMELVQNILDAPTPSDMYEYGAFYETALTLASEV